jgi:hypothetical protein
VTETEKIEQVHKQSKEAAEYWQANFKPVTYSTPFYIAGDWVRVTIELVSPRSVYEGAVGSRETDALKRLDDLRSDG